MSSSEHLIKERQEGLYEQRGSRSWWEIPQRKLTPVHGTSGTTLSRQKLGRLHETEGTTQDACMQQFVELGLFGGPWQRGHGLSLVHEWAFWSTFICGRCLAQSWSRVEGFDPAATWYDRFCWLPLGGPSFFWKVDGGWILREDWWMSRRTEGWTVIVMQNEQKTYQKNHKDRSALQNSLFSCW